MDTKKPFRKARLYCPPADAKDKRWFVEFSAWDERREKLVRKRDLTINSISDLKKRKARANEIIDEINESLKGGAYIKDEDAEIESLDVVYSIKNGLELALASRKSLKPKTYKNYSDYTKNLIRWLVENKKEDYSIKKLNTKMFVEFHDSLTARKLKARTINNHKTHLSTLFVWLLEQKIIEVNPIEGVKKLSEDIGKNLAYTTEQQQEILTFLQGKEHFIFLCKLMYYSLFRTNEISSLKIKDLGRYHPNKMYLSKEWSKNNSERQVDIHPDLKGYILKLKKLDPEWFVFSNGFLPGPIYYNSKNWGTFYRDHVLKKINKALKVEKYTMDYTLYSWKHSGVCAAYLAGASIGEIQMQAGFKDATSFNKYLKSLNLFDNSGFLLKIPTI